MYESHRYVSSLVQISSPQTNLNKPKKYISIKNMPVAILEHSISKFITDNMTKFKTINRLTWPYIISIHNLNIKHSLLVIKELKFLLKIQLNKKKKIMEKVQIK